jgi:uncharacterized repeat protein (TIGR03803 family)
MQYSLKKLIFLFTFHFSLFVFHCEAQTTQLWGMTSKGDGPDSCGVIFRIYSDGTGFQDMHVFTKPTGSFPRGNLINVNGQLFGMTDSGGTKNGGVIFKFDPTYNVYTVLYNFDTAKYNLDTLSGKWSSGSLTYIGNNMLYGMANSGGLYKKGVIFSFNISTNQYSVVHHFQGSDGQFPSGSLFFATNTNFPASVGNLFGMTPLGGSDSMGVVFSLNPSTNVFTKMLDFTGTGTASGANPRGSLIQADNGNLYGMTYGGGDSGRGVIFTLNPLNSSFGLTFTFHGINGAFPYNSLYQANNSKLYGFNISNPNGFNTGSLFRQNLTGLHQDVLDFGATDFGRSYSNVIQAQNGLLYSMTYVCGHDTLNAAPDSAGVIFSIDINNSTMTVLHVFNTNNGANPYGDLLEMPLNTGIPELTKQTFTAPVFPDPVNDMATFTINNLKESSYTLKVYNLLGQELISIFGNNKTIEVDIKEMPAGMYFYQIIQSETNSIANGKFIKE